MNSVHSEVGHDAEVEVWSPYTQRWVDGFVAVRVGAGEVVLRRCCDASVLPPVAAERVRPVRPAPQRLAVSA